MSEHYEHDGEEPPRRLEDTLKEREMELGRSLARVLAEVFDEIRAELEEERARKLLEDIERKSALGEIP